MHVSLVCNELQHRNIQYETRDGIQNLTQLLKAHKRHVIENKILTKTNSPATVEDLDGHAAFNPQHFESMHWGDFGNV